MLMTQDNVIFSEKFRGKLPENRTYVYPVTFYITDGKTDKSFVLTGISSDRLKTRELEEVYGDVSDAITRLNKLDIYDETIAKYKAGLETHDNYLTYHRSFSYVPNVSSSKSPNPQWEFIFPLDRPYDYMEMILDIGVNKGYLNKKVPTPTATQVL